MESQPHLHARIPPTIYLRIAGVYYKRTTGKDWIIIEDPHIVKWDTLHQVQYDMYYPVLLAEGLVKRG